MSQNVKNPEHVIDSFVKALTLANALLPAAEPVVAVVAGIFKKGLKAGKTPAEMEAEAADTVATMSRTKAKSEAQMSDEG
jgi:hypothetical protein